MKHRIKNFYYQFLQIHLGGIDTFLQPGKTLNVRKNFQGCMENVWWNYMNIIKDTRMKQTRFESHGGIQYGVCQVHVKSTFEIIQLCTINAQ